MMTHETTKAILGPNDRKPQIPSPPSTREVTPTVPNSVHQAISTEHVLPKKLSSGPPEIWVPYYIHTAKCDRCGQHNTSVVQRSSRENKQFCKTCMHLNVRDGLYSVNVEGLDWSPRTSSVKRRTRGISKHQKPRKLKKLLKSSTLAGISKSNQRGPRIRAKNRLSFTDLSESENATYSPIIRLNRIGDEEDETENDIGFGQLPQCDFLSSENIALNNKAGTMLSTANAEEVEQVLDCGRETDRENHREASQHVAHNNSQIQRWERLRNSGSNPRGENIHSSLMGLQEPVISADIIEAAKILLKLQKGDW